MEIDLSYIKKPNLVLAIIVAAITIVLGIACSGYVMNFQNTPFIVVYIPYTLCYMAMLFLFSRYLDEIHCSKGEIIVFIIIFILFMQLILNILWDNLWSTGGYQKYVILGGFYNLLNLFRILLHAALGIILLLHKNDYIGGLKILAVFCLIGAFTLICNILQSFYLSHFFIGGAEDINNNIVIKVVRVLNEIAALGFKLSVLYVFIKAYLYNKKMDRV